MALRAGLDGLINALSKEVADSYSRFEAPLLAMEH
jgi:hypothetical protein